MPTAGRPRLRVVRGDEAAMTRLSSFHSFVRSRVAPRRLPLGCAIDLTKRHQSRAVRGRADARLDRPPGARRRRPVRLRRRPRRPHPQRPRPPLARRRASAGRSPPRRSTAAPPLFHDAGCKVTVDGNVWTPPAQHRGPCPSVPRRAAHRMFEAIPDRLTQPTHRALSACWHPDTGGDHALAQDLNASGHDPRKAPHDRHRDDPPPHRPRRMARRPTTVVQRQRRRRRCSTSTRSPR